MSTLFAPLQSLLKIFQTERHYTDEKKESALLAINEALIATKEYVNESRGVKRFDQKREYELARLWAVAAAKSKQASAELATRLQDKSLYWSDTFEWAAEEVKKRKIDFESLEREIHALLKS